MPDLRQNVKTIFGQALAIESADARARFLEQACDGDAPLRAEVEELLGANDRAGGFLAEKWENPLTVDTPFTERPGVQIGPYTIRERIGEGGFGAVFVAEQKEPVMRKVALKVIKPGMDTKDVIARFEAERQALALMDHPNIAKVLDAGATDTGRPYFVMELVHGIPITDFCDQERLSNNERLELFIAVCRAVQHAHQKSIIHRDLKPSNIMVTMHDDQPVVKVIDFGVAKALSKKLTDKTVYTAYGQMIGTPMYMSPEQAQLSGLDIDTRSDVYSLGVLLYELLTGTTPFDQSTFNDVGFDEMRRIIQEDDPPCPSARVSTLRDELRSTASDRRRIDDGRLGASLRGELDWIVMRSLEKRRSRRYQSASELGGDVQNYLDDKPVTACPPSLRYRVGKFARRHRVLLTSSTLVILAILATAVFSSWQAVLASSARNTAEKNEEVARVNERIAKTERDRAIAAREDLRHVLYASELNLLQVAWDNDNFRRVRELLENTRPKEGETDLRGFEWHYWNRQLRGGPDESWLAMSKVESRSVLTSELSPNGQRFALQYFKNDKTFIVIYDTGTARDLLTIDLGTGVSPRGNRMIFSANGKWLAVVRKGRSERISVWNCATGEKKQEFEAAGRVGALAVGNSGERVVYKFGQRSTETNAWEHGLRVFDLTHKGSVYSRDFASDSWYILSFTDRNCKRIGLSHRSGSDPQTGGQARSSLEIIDVDSGQVTAKRDFPPHRITTPKGRTIRLLSPDGAKVIVRDPTAAQEFSILDPQTLETRAILIGDEKLARSTSVAFSLDSRFVAASTASRVFLWSLADVDMNSSPERMPVVRPLVVTNPTLAAAPMSRRTRLRFSSDSRQLLSHQGNRVKFWNFPAGALQRVEWTHGGVGGGSFDHAGAKAVLRVGGREANALMGWDIAADRKTWEYGATSGDTIFGDPTFSRNGKLVAVPTGGRVNRTTIYSELLILDGNTGKKIRSFQPDNAVNISAAIDSEGRRIALLVAQGSAREDSAFVLRLHDLATGDRIFAADVDDASPLLAGFSPDGQELMVAQRANGGLLVLDAANGTRRRIIAPEGTILNRYGAWSLSPDGKTLAVHGFRDQENIAAAFYDAATGERRLSIPLVTDYRPVAVHWSPDSRRLVLESSQMDNTQITVVGARTGRLLVSLERRGFSSSFRSTSQFSSDGQRLMHIASDNRVSRGDQDNPSTHPIHIWDGAPVAEPAAKDATDR